MQQRHEARKLVILATIGILIQGCSPSDDAAGRDLPATVVALEKFYDLELAGSVGDGPIVDAVLTIRSSSGEVLSNTVSDQNAGYNIQVRTQGKHYPLTIEASAGFDLVTRLPLDFKMESVATQPRSKAVVNVNPFTTIAVASARQMNGGISTATLSAAMASVTSQFNLGLTSQLSLDPLSTPIDDTNLAEIIKSSEALAEIIRRTASTIQANSFNASNQFVIDAIGADLVDGKLDGRGSAGASRHVAATTLVVAAQVTLEAMRNELEVNGEIVTPVMDQVIADLSVGAPLELTDARPVTSYMIAQAQAGVAAAITIGGSSSLDFIAAALDILRPGVSAATARQILPADAGATLDGRIMQLGAGSAAAIDAVLPDSASADNTPPVISGTPLATVAQDTLYQFTPGASDADGDNLTFSLLNGPGWLTFNASIGELVGIPGVPDVGTHSNIQLSVTDGQATMSLPIFSIAVQPDVPPPVNTPPVISGTPATSVLQDAAYAFLPGAIDADGDVLTFSITNRPSWADFDSATGASTGTPSAADVAIYANITISVSDGFATTSLAPFAVTVEAVALPPPPPPPPPNVPPVIAGVPLTSVLQDTNYQFVPTASDADGDVLTFSITNRPAWAIFNSATGTVTGSPSAADIATYANITISVSDGIATTSLAPFAITVDAIALGAATLSWEAPTTNVDGSPLLDLAGYRIHWGQQSGNYSNSITVMNPGITAYVVENLASGTYYFAVTALRSNGLESTFSNEGSKIFL